MKSHPNRVVTHYQIAGLVGKAYLKSATTAIAAEEIRKTGLLPCNCHILDEHDYLEESQRTITRCLLDSPVPCTNISEQSSSTSGRYPQTPNNSHSAYFTKRPLLLFCPQTLVLFEISSAGNKNIQQNMQHSHKGSAAILTARLTKTNFKKTSRGKRLEIRGNFPKYGFQKKKNSGLCDAYVSVH